MEVNHGREEFDLWQPPPGMFPPGMPVFALIGIDLSSPESIASWAYRAERRRQRQRAAAAWRQHDRFLSWQEANPELCKWPMDPVD
ncbi:hypothetical protein ACIBEJ_35185 [Nonomuraea sp. NPDC050790]|uniref:hypothetical protein n=1 Tax=Nonomuraea sp. NPDC050790 TaxID=3364371 RepID=UPI00379C3DE5